MPRVRVGWEWLALPPEVRESTLVEQAVRNGIWLVGGTIPLEAEHAEEAPAALERLQQVALADGNIFEELMNTVRVCSLGQITQALYDVGGQYRRNM